MANLEIQWNTPPTGWPLNETEVHVWAAALDVSPDRISAFETTLSPDERYRAGRFHFERDQRHFISGRARLRTILGSYLQIKPEDLQFEYSARGKPALAHPFNRHKLHFNLAHSDGLLLVAVSQLCPLGVDVERTKWIENTEDLVSRFFSPSEAADFHALPDARRMNAFFNLWTRKEACLKATGDGLSGQLQEMRVSFLPGEPARVLSTPLDTPHPAGAWTLHELKPAPGYIAALAMTEQPLKLSCWHWTR
jgi:4'-phosphopantetheinyl transferase